MPAKHESLEKTAVVDHRETKTSCSPSTCQRDVLSRSSPSARAAGRSGLGDSGQTTPLIALGLALVAGAIILLALLGNLATDRARARTAADAAALAGAAEGPDVARRVAAANGSSIEAYHRAGDEVEVTVKVGDARATARAQLRWIVHQ